LRKACLDHATRPQPWEVLADAGQNTTHEVSSTTSVKGSIGGLQLTGWVSETAFQSWERQRHTGTDRTWLRSCKQTMTEP
jgi:hypothetical protein